MTSALGVATAKKLGKKPPRHDPRTLHIGDYLDKAKILPVAPPARDWNDQLPVELGMMANDQYGDCGFAGLGHAFQTWSSQHGPAVTFSDEVVLKWYADCTGFSKDDPATDNGVVLLDALSYFRKEGLIYAFAKVNHHNLDQLQIAINLFGGIYTGAGLPLSAQDTSHAWHGKRGSLGGDDAVGGWGGHCMWSAKYLRRARREFTVDFSTWGKRQEADEQWFLNYVDECYVMLSTSWADGTIAAPSGFDFVQLEADLHAIGT